eukprot:Sspe_Gene.102310::Locus_77319_Transcript_1_2_Confidence_0.750_Length_475::g.102310::m.102310
MGWKKCLSKSMAWLDREGESYDERFRKRLLGFVILGSLPPTVLDMLFKVHYSLAFGHLIVTVIVNCAIVAYLRYTRRCSVRMMEGILLWLLLDIILVLDLMNYGRTELWVMCIILMDLMLLCRARDRTVTLAMLTSLLYIT